MQLSFKVAQGQKFSSEMTLEEYKTENRLQKVICRANVMTFVAE